MLSSLLENQLVDIKAATLTDVFLVGMLILFVVSYTLKVRHKHQAFTQYTPTLLTSLGILGTFAGIIIGLLSFDTAHIDTSIGPLLEGLKTAFISSLAGMLLSIIYKACVTFGVLIKKQDSIVGDDDISPTDFYQIFQQQTSAIEQLKQVISEDNGSSLIGVIKSLKSDANDHYKDNRKGIAEVVEGLAKVNAQSEQQQQAFSHFTEKLWIELTNFAELLSKSATEQVIEALNNVIKDFNEKLTEQFGENFKELNKAVVSLVEWQENYKHQLTDMREKYQLGVNAIADTQQSVASISSDAKMIPSTMQELKVVMEVNQNQVEELDRHLAAFAEMRDKAVAAVPDIQANIDHAIQGAQAANETLAEGMKNSAEHMHKVLSQGSEEFKDNVNQTSAAMMEATQTTSNTSEQIKDQLTTAVEEINHSLRNLFEDVKQKSEVLNNNYEAAGQQLTSETQRITQEIATSLSDSSLQFSQTIQKSSQGLNDNYKAAGEQLKDQTGRITQELSQSLTDASTGLSQTIQQNSQDLNDNYKAMSQQLKDDTGRISKNLEQAITNTSSQLTQTIQEQAQSHRQQAEKIFNGLESTIKDALSQTGESVTSQIDMVDKAAEKEINQVMQSMGNALIRITKQFTNDYSKLVEQMNHVVNQY